MSTTDPSARIADVLKRAQEVSWGVAVADTATGRMLAEHDSRKTFRTASLGKLLLLLDVARALSAGALGSGELLTPRPEDDVEDSGLWQQLGVASLPAADVAALVGAFSDNLATNVLLRRMGGPAAIAEFAEMHNIRHVELLDRVRDSRGPQDPPTLSRATAAGLVDLLHRIRHGEVIGQNVCDQVLHWMSLNADLSMVGSALGLDPLCHHRPDRGLQLWNKTGTISDIRADVGLVESDGTCLAYAVIAEWDNDRRPAARDVALAGMRAIGESLRAYLAASARRSSTG